MKEKVLIAGGSGLVGKRLCQLLIEKGYEVSILSRSRKKIKDVNVILWDPYKGEIEHSAFETDHLINLAGAGIADRPWTKSRKKELIDSRVISTNFLFDQFTDNNKSLKSYVGASAIGYYGDGGDTLQEESNTPAYKSFMTELCSDWEAVHKRFESLCTQVSILRIGIVLSTLGGAYPKMRLSFKFGIGSYFGAGQQYYSWIHIDDLAMMFIHLIKKDQKGAVYNAVSPHPVTNKTLVETIKSSLGISALVIPAPAFVLKMAMGQLSRVILNSNRVSSQKIEDAGFSFEYGELTDAIKDIESKKI